MSRYDFDECYHLAAQSFVAESFADGFSTMNTNINGTHYMLAALRELRPQCRFYFAGSSEMFGKVREVPQSENDAVLSAQPLWHQQSCRLRLDAELSRSLRHVLLPAAFSSIMKDLAAVMSL